MPRYIDVDALEKEMLFWCDTYNYGGLTKDNIREIIKNFPAADVVERKSGKWLVIRSEPYVTFEKCKCSECGVVEYFNIGWKKFNYCPNCGAEMERE